MTMRDRLDLVRAKDLTLGTLFERLALVYGDTGLVEESDGGLALTHAEGADLVARLAGGIRSRIEPGDRVVVATPNGYGLLLASLAVSRAGGVAVPVNPKMSADEAEHVRADSGASLVIDDLDGLAADAIEAAPVDPGDVAVLFYTSGTTGKPKGAKLTHRSLVGGVGGYAAAVPLSWIRQECVTGMPVAHVAGFAVLVQMAALGVPVYLLTRFRPDDALDAIEQRRATMFVGVPAMYRMMIEAGAEQRDLRSVRMWSSGADVMPADLAHKYQRMGAALTLPFVGRPVGVATFIDGYGMVELGGGVAIRVFPPGVPLKGSGLVRPIRGHQIKVLDDNGGAVERGEVGELVVKGPGVMRGYHGKDEETAEALTSDGWLRTGDLARERRFGFIEFAGRKKDVIKHGGYSVFAVEVETVLNEHPAVAESAVVGLEDERKGEIPAAVVRLEDGATLEEDELIAFAKERLSDYKVPQRVKVVDDLPRTGTDKVKKAELKPLFS